MSSFSQHIARHEKHLEHVNAKIFDYEETASKAKGPIGKEFAQHLADATTERDRLIDQLKQLRLENALAWAPTRSGMLQVCDEIGHRLDEALGYLEHRGPR